MKRWLVLLILISGCASGTGTGNPSTPTSGKNPGGAGGPEFSLTQGICTLLSSCFSVSYSDCVSGLATQTNIDLEVGIAVGVYANYQALVYAATGGDISYDATALSLCVTQVQALSCSAANVQNAYLPGQANPFAGVADMLPTGAGSCPDVF